MSKPYKHRILVIDDEIDIVDMVRRMLRSKYEVTGATRVAEALELFENNFFDVVLADQRLVDGTGTQLLSRFADLNPLTRRISMSGNAEHSDLMAAINVAKVSRFLLKPIDKDLLLDTIGESLAEYERERQAMEEMLMRRYAGRDSQRLPPAPGAGTRSRPEGWPAGPGIERIQDSEPESLAALLGDGLAVGVARLQPEDSLDDRASRAWTAELELRLVTMLRETDHSFRLPGSRFVVAFARTTAVGCERACQRLAAGLSGGIRYGLVRWPEDAPEGDALALARAILDEP